MCRLATQKRYEIGSISLRQGVSGQCSVHLRFDCHAKEVARACNYSTRALRHVRTVLTDDLAQTAASSIVASRLDYCNAILYGAPAATFDVLQPAQNNLARVVCQRGGQTDARPLLRSLHWLPVQHRVAYKMAALTFKTMSSSTPAYLNDLIQTAVPARLLWSSDSPLLNVPRTRTEFARRSFSVAAPHTYANSLPSDIRSCRTVDTSNDTSRPICSDSLNLMPPAPLSLRTLWRHTNAVITIIIRPIAIAYSMGQIIQDAQLSQRDRAAACVIVFAKSRSLELGDNILRTL